MKRHPALEALSRDHHHALVVALRLKRADEESGPAARDGFLSYWQSDGREHFREEEEILLPACAGSIDLDQPLVARVLTDHIRIRHLADVVGNTDVTPLEMLHSLGEQLEKHIRLEERELFPLIEASLPEAELRQLVAALSH